jgi:hypothetical protein
LVQSAREIYKRLVEVLTDVDFTENKSEDEDGIFLIGIYADDCLVTGKEVQISKLILDLKAELSCLGK